MSRLPKIFLILLCLVIFIYPLVVAGPMSFFFKGKKHSHKDAYFLKYGADQIEVPTDILVSGDAGDQSFDDGQVLDTPEEGVPFGELNIDNSGGGASFAISKGELKFSSSAGWGNVGAYSQAITRDTGLTMFASIKNAVATHIAAIGWKEDANSNFSGGGGDRWGYDVGSATSQLNETAANDLEEMGAVVNNTEYHVAFALGGYNVGGVPFRAGQTASDFNYGVAYWIRFGTWGNWKLVWRDNQQNSTPMYAAFGTNSATQITIDSLIVPGTALDPDVILNPAYYDATPDNSAIDIGTGDALIDTNVTFGAGVATFHVRFRLQDASNYWNVKALSGTAGADFTLHKTTATVEAGAVASADVDFTAAAHDIRIIADGSTFFRVYVDKALKLSYSGPDTDFEDETGVQLVDGGAAFTENLLVVYNRSNTDINDLFETATGGIYIADPF